MVAATAREIRDGELVFVGMRLPLMAFVVAKRTHAPAAVGVFEAGVIREEPPSQPLYTMGDAANISGAAWCTTLTNVMGLLGQGDVGLGLIGGAEIDRHGNLNTSSIGPWARPSVRLPGSGGAADIASLAGRLVVLMAHERRRFVERVDFVTSPGHGAGGTWREEVGLPGGGPSAVVTTLGVLRFEDGEMVLASVHPGVAVEEALAETGWPLRVAPSLAETPAPTPEELRALREYDPSGFWTR